VQHQIMDEMTERQLRVIRKVIAVTEAAGISVWLFGGWGLDARIGRITRQHGDVEFWAERINAEQSKAALIAAGATALATQPPAETCEFMWDGVPFSTAYFDRLPDGSSVQLLGRWSDWLFPPGSFGDEPGTLDGTPVMAMSVAGMLAMKEQFRTCATADLGGRRTSQTSLCSASWPPETTSLKAANLPPATRSA
jgi:Aminoglycoside-2''-adenylyltransferase